MYHDLPIYKCHKEVAALKIKSIELDEDQAKIENRDSDGSAMITPENESFEAFRVDAEYVSKHKPVAGGYFVVYKDEYQSFSPAEAFEEGYTQL